MSLSDLSIRRPVFAWMLMSGFIVFGAIGLSRLGISQMPDVDFPVLVVNLTWPGASPDVMEAEIVDPIEQTLIATQGIRDMSSNIQMGQAAITLEFNINRNVDAALTEVQSKMSAVRLPVGSNPATIDKTNPEDEPIVLLSVTGQRSLHALTEYIDTVLADDFRRLPGVGEVVFSGFNVRNLRIWVDNNKLKPLELTILDVQTALQNEHLEEASGYLEDNNVQMNLRTMGEGMTPEQVGAIQIKSRGGGPIYNSTIRIRDVARVEDGLDDIQHLGVVQNGAALALGIKKQRGVNAVAVAREVKEKLAEIQPLLPKDIQVEINFDSTHFIEQAINETLFTLVLSSLATGLVCLLFLGSFSSTFNVLLSIPTSIMGTFLVIYFAGFTLNFFTLLGLSLAIGIIVDDAIMVLENIVRHAEMGKDKVTAAEDGAREITFAAIVTTVAVIAIFLPVIFMDGIIGKYFYQFGITISAAVLLSLVEAVTITPMRCSQLLTTRKSEDSWARLSSRVFDSWADFYRRVLGWCLAHRWIVVFSSTALFLASLGIGYLLPSEFLPPEDQGVFVIHAETPAGSSLHYTADKLVAAEEILKRHPEIDHFFAAIGGFSYITGSTDGNISDSVVNAGTIYITLKPQSERKIEQHALMQKLRDELSAIPDLKAVPQDLSTRDFTASKGFPVELNIRGEDYSVLAKTAQKIIGRLQTTGLMTDFDTDLREGMPEVHVIPDRNAAALSGITIASIANTVSDAIGGVVQGQFSNGDDRYNVNIRLENNQTRNIDDIKELQVRTSGNELVPITNVVKFEEVKTYQTMTRRLRERSITIFANVLPGKSQAHALDIAEKISKEEMPLGYRLFLGGGALAFREAFFGLTFSLWLGVFIAYMVLASQFNSFVHPITVLLALPFSVTGAFLALYLTHQSINLYSMIGLILLMGIVKKNSILLVEFANQQRDRFGGTAHQAMLRAAPIRLRPILMTSFAVLAAAIPPALALGPGAESRIPMAVTILGGVSVSTFFTLLVVPCAYSLFSQLERRPRLTPTRAHRAEPVLVPTH